MFDQNYLRHFAYAEITVLWFEDKDHKYVIFSTTELIPKMKYEKRFKGGTKSIRNTHTKLQNTKFFLKQLRVSVADGIQYFKTHELTDDDLHGIIFPKDVVRLPDTDSLTLNTIGQYSHYLQAHPIALMLPERTNSLNVIAQLNNDQKYFKTVYELKITEIQKYYKKVINKHSVPHAEFFGANILCIQDPYIAKVKIKRMRQTNTLAVMIFTRGVFKSNYFRCAIKKSNHNSDALQIHSITEQCFTIPYVYDHKSGDDCDELLIWSKDGLLIEKVRICLMTQFYSTFHSRQLPNGKRQPVWSDSYYEQKSDRLSFVEKAMLKRKYDYIDALDIFHYFKKEDREQAIAFLQNKLSNAWNITICDPYFDINSINTFIKGWLLCKKLTIVRAQFKDNDAREQLFEQLKNINSQFRECELFYSKINNNIGDILHDRFIIIDGMVWCIGGSLNGIGKKDISIFRSPNPDPFIERVHEITQTKAALKLTLESSDD